MRNPTGPISWGEFGFQFCHFFVTSPVCIITASIAHVAAKQFYYVVVVVEFHNHLSVLRETTDNIMKTKACTVITIRWNTVQPKDNGHCTHHGSTAMST